MPTSVNPMKTTSMDLPCEIYGITVPGFTPFSATKQAAKQSNLVIE